MILSGGENIAASVIERVFYEHDSGHEAVAIGLPDDRWGECLVAGLRCGAALTLEELQSHCRARLAGFTVPKELHLRPALPRNPSGKVLERLLHEELAGRRGA